MASRLTLAVLLQLQDKTFPTDTPHGVAVLDVAKQQLLLEERPCGGVVDLTRVQEPRTMDPRVTTGGGYRVV